MVLDVVTIDSRVSGHLLVPSRGVPRELSRNSYPSPLKLLSPFLARGNPFRGSCNIARVVPRSRLSRDYSRLSTTSSTRARAALTLAFSTRLFSLSFPKTSLDTLACFHLHILRILHPGNSSFDCHDLDIFQTFHIQ